VTIFPASVLVIESGKNEPVFETTMMGPILLAKLAPGSYTIKATVGARTLTRTVAVEAQGSGKSIFAGPMLGRISASADQSSND
jgi:hypothetical protein